MNQEAALKMTIARTAMLIDHPFFGELALRLRLVEDATGGTKTMSVDGKTVRYNPDFVMEISSGLTRAIVAHEVMHCVFGHMSRRGGRNPKKWNSAGDYAINPILEKAGFSFEGTGLLNPAFDGMTADEIYSLLPDSEDGKGDSPTDELLDSDPNEAAVESTEWKIATIQAAQSAKGQGKLPAHLERFIEEMLAPKVDWRERLRRFVTQSAKDDYSWVRPNRRFMPAFILPSLHSESMGEMVVAIDTSGSIGQETLDAFAAEITAIVQSSRPSKTTVIYCDAEVNHVDEFAPTDELVFKLHGGGGTDFRPPFEYVAENNIAPVCFVYLTDMYGPFPTDPGYPVMWCATTDVVAPFGETVPIDV